MLVAGAIWYFESMSARPSIALDEQELLLPEDVTTEQTTELSEVDKARIKVKEGLFPRAPELTGIVGWLNTDESLRIADLRGKVVLVDFWTYTCINCIRTLPFITEWDRKYRDKGLVTIGVHTPEFEFEKKRENVQDAMLKHNIEYAVVQDNDYRTFRAYQNRFWPRKYVIDGDGFIRYDHVGEGAYQETEKVIQELLEELGKDVKDMPTSQLEDRTPTRGQTPELYAGYGFALSRGQNVANGGLRPDNSLVYQLPDKLEKDVIYLEGEWMSNADHLLAMEDDASIVLDFTSIAANIVVDFEEKGTRMYVFVDGDYVTEELAGDDVQFENGKAFVEITEPQLYNIVRGEYGNHVLKLTADKKGFSFNAFTFG